jgi:hypothetical protein
VAHRIVSQTQTAFIKGRFIQDGALALHEILHEITSKNMQAIVLKLDFEKAYDRVNWDFLKEVLLRKGFSGAYMHRIMQLLVVARLPFRLMERLVHFFAISVE